MHIPRQPDGSRERAARRPGLVDGAAGTVPGPAALGSDGLRARRQDLVAQQRAVAYWQRLVQARTDLVVAGLLYGTPVADPDDLHALAALPDGIDVAGLLGVVSLDAEGPSGHLDRLRLAARLLAQRRRRVDDELDGVTLALHDRFAGTTG